VGASPDPRGCSSPADPRQIRCCPVPCFGQGWARFSVRGLAPPVPRARESSGGRKADSKVPDPLPHHSRIGLEIWGREPPTNPHATISRVAGGRSSCQPSPRFEIYLKTPLWCPVYLKIERWYSGYFQKTTFSCSRHRSGLRAPRSIRIRIRIRSVYVCCVLVRKKR
jgi:hypothetical protein